MQDDETHSQMRAAQHHVCAGVRSVSIPRVVSHLPPSERTPARIQLDNSYQHCHHQQRCGHDFELD